MSKIDHFPIVKRHIERLPVKLQRETYLLIEKELNEREIAYISDTDKLMTEAYLHDLIDAWMEDYYDSRKDLPND